MTESTNNKTAAAAEKTITLIISGMSCSSCVAGIEKKLRALPGIYDVNVSIATNKGRVSFDPDRLKQETIIETVESGGYSARIDSGTPGLEIDEDEKKIRESLNRMIVAAAISAIVMILMMIQMFVVPVPGYLIITAILGFPVVFIAGGHVHRAAFIALKSGSPNMDVLVSLGSLPPYLIGLLAFFFPIQTFIEMAVTIMTFHLIGKHLEVRARGRASQAIRKLIQMGAKTARIIEDGAEREIPVQELQPGHIMLIRPGDKIPADGVIVEGTSTVDESMATGESMPVKRSQGEAVIGATINGPGLLKVEATRVGQDTFLAQVIRMVEECQGSRVPIQEFADRVTGYFVPTILILTAITFVSFNLFSDFHIAVISWGAQYLPWANPDLPPLTLAFITATAVLVISCPCALGLGTPTALMVGSGIGAERGILIRNGEAIQTLKDVKAIALDKTGTITVGRPAVTDLMQLSRMPAEKVLYYAAALENASEHPLGRAIVEKAANPEPEAAAGPTAGEAAGSVKDFHSETGMGVSGLVEGHKVLVGSRKLMKKHYIQTEQHEGELSRLEMDARTAMLIAVDGDLVAIIAVADPLKEESASAISELESMGISTAMITGDNRRTAEAIARRTGISHVIAEVMPDGKVSGIRDLQQKFGNVAMVGDGINDAPALKQANVGIALGTGTDIAMETADVTLVRGDLTGIVSAVKLSRAIFRKIQENYFWAWFYNVVAIPVAMLGLLHPMIGAAAMAMSSLNVIYNSLRLKSEWQTGKA